MSHQTDLELLTPFVREATDRIKAIESVDVQQDAKLGEHDRAFASFHQDLVTLRNIFQTQIEHIDAMLRRHGVTNGR